MSITPEIILIKYFIKNKTNFTQHKNIFKELTLEKEINLIFKLIENYYTDIEHHEYIGEDELISYFLIQYPLIKEKDIILEMIKLIYSVDISNSLIQEHIKNLVEKDVANKIVNKLLPVLTENKFNLLRTVTEDLEYFSQFAKKQDEESPFNEDDLETLLDKHVTGGGLNWNLQCLQEDIGPLRPGDLGHIFARVETGKSSFIASELSGMVDQLSDEEIILYCSNEEASGKLKLRLYQTLTGLTKEAVVADVRNAKDVFNKRGGNKVKYIGDVLQLSLIEELCAEYKPRLLIVDSADAVSFRGDKNMEGPIKLKLLYEHYRRLANRYQVPVLTVGQASAEVAGKKWLEMHHMDFSKTGKPAALDFAIGIGKLMDGSSDDLRYLNIPKNKLTGKHSKHTVLFDYTTAIYSDI